MNVLLISTYELGHQPFGLASPKAWLARDGHSVRCADLAIEALPDSWIQDAELVAFYLPMHTATRLAVPVMKRVRGLNPAAHLACYGLYAPLNNDLLRSLGVDTVIGGEFEAALTTLARGKPVAGFSAGLSMDRLDFITPERELPASPKYARLQHAGETVPVAYTEASRGCKHLCRHCPVVPVYRGQFRVVQSEVVLADIRQQVAAGAGHVTFGDPDFLNGPAHALRIVEALHAEFPAVTYDATIKIEHLLKHRDLLPVLRDTGCLFITSAAESVDDDVLAKLEKHHTRQDFVQAVSLTRDAGLTLQPTFIAFTPWTTIKGYRDLLKVVADLDLVENVGPVQLALRLLITSGSRLLELEDVRGWIAPFDPKLLVYPWKHPDPEVDALGANVFRVVQDGQKQGCSRTDIFREISRLAGTRLEPRPQPAVPALDEPWYCCAEPTEDQLAHL